MKDMRRYLAPILILLGVLALSIGFRTLATSVIVQPIAVLAWAAWRILLSVDQDVYWLIVLLACTVAAISLLPSPRRGQGQQAYARDFLPPAPVAYWRRRLEAAFAHKGQPEALRAGLRDLFISVVIDAGGHSLLRLESLIDAQPGEYPAGVKLLFPRPQFRREEPASVGRRFALCLKSGWAGLRGTRSPQLGAAPVDELLTWMESRLETKREQRN